MLTYDEIIQMKKLKNSKNIVIFSLIIVVIITIFLGKGLLSNNKNNNQANILSNNNNIDLSFSPSIITAKLGNFDVGVKAGGDMLIAGYSFTISFDKTKMQVAENGINYKIGAPSTGLSDTNSEINKINNSGSIKIKGEIQSADGYKLSGENIITIRFLSKSESTSNIKILDPIFTKINPDFTLEDVAGSEISAVAN